MADEMDPKPSEVFLELWRRRSLMTEATPEEFKAYADAWLHIRELEAPPQPRRKPKFTARAASKIDAQPRQKSTLKSVDPTPRTVQNGHALPTPWDSYMEETRRRLIMTAFSIEKIAQASDKALKADQVRAFMDGRGNGADAAAVNRALDRLEGKGKDGK